MSDDPRSRIITEVADELEHPKPVQPENNAPLVASGSTLPTQITPELTQESEPTVQVDKPMTPSPRIQPVVPPSRHSTRLDTAQPPRRLISEM